MKRNFKLILFILLLSNAQKNWSMELPAAAVGLTGSAGGYVFTLVGVGLIQVAAESGAVVGTFTYGSLAGGTTVLGTTGAFAVLNLLNVVPATVPTGVITGSILAGVGAAGGTAAGAAGGAGTVAGAAGGAAAAGAAGAGTAAGVGAVAVTPPGWVLAAAAVGAGWYTFQATVVLLGVTAAIMGGVKGATMKEQADGLCFSHPHFVLSNDMPFPVEYRLYSDSFPTQIEYKYTKVADLDIQNRLDTITSQSAFENEIKKDDLKLAKKSNVILVRVLKKNGDEVDTFQPVKVDAKGFKYISITLDPKVDQDAKFIYHQLFFERGKRNIITGVEARFKDKEGKEHVLFTPGKWDVDHGNVGKGYKAYRATLIQKFDEKNSTLCTRLDVDKRSCTVTPFA